MPDPQKFRRAITYGTFDLFHVGHVRILKAARELASELYVGISTDEFNAGKGKHSVIPFAQRVEIVEACRWADHVFAEESWEQKEADVKRFDADLFLMGDDWRGKFDFLAPHCTVMYLPRTPDVSSTEIKQLLSSFSEARVQELRDAVETIGFLVKALR
jgi:glycerol-3-phosphate cytidylyltransferase